MIRRLGIGFAISVFASAMGCGGAAVTPDPGGASGGTATGTTGSSTTGITTSGASGGGGSSGTTSGTSGTYGTSGASGTPAGTSGSGFSGATGVAGNGLSGSLSGSGGGSLTGSSGVTSGAGVGTGITGTTGQAVDPLAGTGLDGNCVPPTPFAPCGGDLTGTWGLSDQCFTIPYPTDAGCPGATASIQNTGYYETISYSSDGTYDISTGVSGSGLQAVTVPASCFADSEDAGADCFNGPYNLFTDLYQWNSFSGVPSDSLCGFYGPTTFTGQSSLGSGSYTVSGSTITMVPQETDAGPAAAASAYCVQGQDLILFGASFAGIPTLQSVPDGGTNPYMVFVRVQPPFSPPAL